MLDWGSKVSKGICCGVFFLQGFELPEYVTTYSRSQNLHAKFRAQIMSVKFEPYFKFSVAHELLQAL